MAKDKLELTVEEGNELLRISSNFSLPEKLGENTYTVADRSIATTDEVGALRRELRSYSPLLQAAERWLCFGPTDVWSEIKGENGKIGHRLLKPECLVPIKLTEEIRSGISWCLLVAIHPSSPTCRSFQVQQDLLWPLAKKVGVVHQLRELIGISGKAQSKRWKADEEIETSTEDLEEKK